MTLWAAVVLAVAALRGAARDLKGKTARDLAAERKQTHLVAFYDGAR